MTDFMESIYEYLLENRFNNYMPSKYFWHYTRVLDLRERTLRDTLSEEQIELLEQYQLIKSSCRDLEDQAIFQAAWDLSRELR